MNWWMLAGGLSALLCTAGHAFAGVGMFYRPDQGGHRQSLASRRIYRNVASHHDQFRAVGDRALCPRRLWARKRSSVAGGTIRRLRRRLPGYIAASWRSVTAVSMDAFRHHRDLGGNWRTNGALSGKHAGTPVDRALNPPEWNEVHPPPRSGGGCIMLPLPQAAAPCRARLRPSSAQAPRRPPPRRARARRTRLPCARSRECRHNPCGCAPAA